MTEENSQPTSIFAAAVADLPDEMANDRRFFELNPARKTRVRVAFPNEREELERAHGEPFRLPLYVVVRHIAEGTCVRFHFEASKYIDVGVDERDAVRMLESLGRRVRLIVRDIEKQILKKIRSEKSHAGS